MKAPSIPLLRALRTTATTGTTLRPHHQTPHHLYSHRPHHPPQPLLFPFTSRPLSTTHHLLSSTPTTVPQTKDRGPTSTESTQTDFSAMDVFSNAPAPTASIDACLSDGFHLDNGVKITSGSGLLLVAGEAFMWRPWEAGGRGRLLNRRGQWGMAVEAWGVLGLVWPKPGRS